MASSKVWVQPSPAAALPPRPADPVPCTLRRPLVVAAAQHHLPGGPSSLAELERFVVWVLDTASAYAWAPAGGSARTAGGAAGGAAGGGDGQWAVLFDLRAISYKNLHLAAVRGRGGVVLSLPLLLSLHPSRRFPQTGLVATALVATCFPHQAKSIFHILERHFPERLAALYLLDAGCVFHATWYLIKPCIDP